MSSKHVSTKLYRSILKYCAVKKQMCNQLLSLVAQSIILALIKNFFIFLQLHTSTSTLIMDGAKHTYITYILAGLPTLFSTH